MIAQSSLRRATSSVQTHLERLSSGLRINKASDDPASLAISSLLDVDRRVSLQGIRNINDGASLLNIADGTLSELKNIVTRISELSVQASNGTLGATQRKALDAEAQALSQEYTRITRGTKFNGLAMLHGDVDVLNIQMGYGSDGAIASGTGGAIGDGTFQARVTVALGTNGGLPRYIDDLNFDGFFDLVYADSGTSQVIVRMGNGDGTFNVNQTLALIGTGVDSAVADYNNDGYVDILSRETANDTLTFFLGNSNGTFRSGISFASGVAGSGRIFSADLNVDGIADVVQADTTADIFSARLGNGDGTFSITQIVTTSLQVDSITLDDLNGDGVTDVAIGEATTNSIHIFLGNGNGTFKAARSYQSGTTPKGVAISGDLNGDGKVDLSVADSADDTISVFIGNGDGTFKARVTYQTGDSPQSSDSYDVNNDGYLDLIINDNNDSTLSILLGNGDGSFRARSTLATGGAPQLPRSGVGFKDFSGDGANDLVSFDNTEKTLSIYRANTKSGVSPLPSFSLASRNGALKAVPLFEKVRTLLSAHQGTLGAFQSRLQSALNVTSASGENFAAARSRIVDADVAQEAAGLTKNNILQQVSTAILAQANQQPALALTLLGRS